MDKLKIPYDGLVLVCDGTKALLFRNAGDKDLVNLQTLESFKQPVPAAHDLGADRPGRVYQSMSTARSTSEERDLHTEAEVAFLVNIAKELDRVVKDQASKSVTVVAPPKALGVLREHFSAALKSVIVAEIGKDLAHLSTGEIESHLTA